jgi:hypothetical protein
MEDPKRLVPLVPSRFIRCAAWLFRLIGFEMTVVCLICEHPIALANIDGHREWHSRRGDYAI